TDRRIADARTVELRRGANRSPAVDDSEVRLQDVAEQQTTDRIGSVENHVRRVCRRLNPACLLNFTDSIGSSAQARELEEAAGVSDRIWLVDFKRAVQVHVDVELPIGQAGFAGFQSAVAVRVEELQA